MRAQHEIDTAGLGARIEALPGVGEVRECARRAGVEAYLVGGAVRDALLGAERADLDVVTEGDHLALARALGGPLREHDRFGTATVETEAGPIDIARARSETYARPGALPEVRPARLADDLARRDFTINAIAVSLAEPSAPIDPHGGVADLGRGLLRVLHARSFADDPTRALRAARYVSRLELELEPGTRAGLEAAELETVSADRIDAELRKLALEPAPRRGFELLDEWGLVALAPGGGELIERLAALLSRAPWGRLTSPAEVLPRAARGELGAAPQLAAERPPSPSAAVAAARGHDGVVLAIARALGAEWLDRYLEEWRLVRPSITGADLLAAGIPQGPAVGRGLEAALEARLDGEAGDREAELRVALAAAAADG